MTVHPPSVVDGLIRSCHPQPAAAVTVMSALLSVAFGRDPLWTVITTLAVLAGQLSIGWSNDALDAARDAAVARTDKPAAAGQVSVPLVRRAAVVAVVLCVPLSLACGVVGWLHLLAVGCGWAYNLGLKATALSPLPYVVAFGLLPVFALGSVHAPWWLPAAGALLGAGAHFANVLPDLADDARTGVRGLPHRLGARGTRTAAAGLLLGAGAVLAVGATGLPAWLRIAVVPATLAGCLAGLRAAGRRDGSRAAFTAVMALAGVDVVLLVLAGRGVR